MGRAIELRHRHDVGAHVGEVEDRIVESGLAGTRAQRFDTAFELGDAPLQHRRGRIADAAIGGLRVRKRRSRHGFKRLLLFCRPDRVSLQSVYALCGIARNSPDRFAGLVHAAADAESMRGGPLDFEIEQSGTAPILLRPIDYGADIVVHSLTLGGHGTQRIKRSCTTYSRTAIAGFAPAISCGDTFRWKGENVATSEVAAAIMAFSGITEANVYGVRVPGNEGAAGMAAIVPDGWLDVAALRAHLAQRLPAYARPKFLRVAKELAKTSTFKHTKNDLQRDGFDPAATRDTIYFTIRRATLSCRSTRRCTSGSKPAWCGFEPVACSRYRSAVCGEVGLISRGLLPKCDLKWRLNWA
jgi:hypothetical protein